MKRILFLTQFILFGKIGLQTNCSSELIIKKLKKMNNELTSLQAVKKSLFRILCCLFCITTSLSAQNRISEKIVDSKNEPLVGASVLVKGTSNGTIVDTEGAFTIDNVAKGSTLVVSFVGYATQEVTTEASIIKVILSDGSALNELIVVGYGTQERRDVTGAVSSIKSQNIKDLPVTRLDQKNGRASGWRSSKPSVGYAGQWPCDSDSRVGFYRGG